MASDTVIESEPAPRERVAWRWFGGSRLGRLIVGLNLVGLVVLVVGALVMNEFRQGLIQTRLDSLSAQAELLAEVIAEGATRGEPQPELEPIAVLVLQRFIPQGQRARLFDAEGNLLADSYVVSEDVDVKALPPARKPDARPPRKPDEAKEAKLEADARADLDAEVARALKGQRVADVRHSETGERVVSVSIPVQRVEAVLGVLTLEAGDVDAIVAAQRRALLPFAAIALGVTLLSSLLLHVLVARPVMRLSAAADQVRLSRARAISLPDLEARNDEIGDLARSLETMTATLSDRMDAIERFAADVSHEIKNPLTSIRSAVETLDLVKDDKAKDRLTGVLKQDVKRLDRLITDISNASRLDAELSRDQPKPVDLGRLLGDLTAAYNDAVREGEPVVKLVLPSEPLRVAGREGPLGQVFRNLIDNARSFGEPGGKVTVALQRSDVDPARPVLLRVEDDGPGVPVENLETIFQRFYTSRPKGAAFGGNSGLGLSISRQIVEAHGGRIWAENMTGPDGQVRGARLSVALPEAAR
ncbi:ATP-binding protein [Caulobacter sp. 17J65-9]|uniref:ATP-binding protein n=1 Tax=Caulobacter sp. 17J65-9 TaxID=2709382 RepID=UPI0013CB2AB6|nr:ATP-binding protein [Caulobacter sp. 17J65-9]NEX94139.1 histidine kinase [Caulobacter sp. 17J65-9]